MIKYLIIAILVIAAIQIIILLYSGARFTNKHFMVAEVDFEQRYGAALKEPTGSWVVVTAASSGQGKNFALEMAERGFNLILIGSERTEQTIEELDQTKTQVIFIKKDFRKAYEETFFDEVVEKIKEVDGNIAGLINNVGYRTGWNPYHETPVNDINDSIVVGTIVQAQLTRICIPYFLKRTEKSFIINITAQCIFPTFGLGHFTENNISVPYLSVYEAANAFGFYHGNSIYKEYSMPKYNNKINILNVMPGAVLTENTSNYLKDTMFAVDSEIFVKNVVRQIGNYEGNVYGHWGHEFSIFLVNSFPFLKEKTLTKVGESISSDFMHKHNSKIRKEYN